MQILKSAIVAVAASVAAVSLSAQPAIDLSLIYDSKYVSEGRDNLGDGGLVSFEAVAGFENGVAVGTWYAVSTDDVVDYEEQNYFAEYGFMVGSVEAYVGYTHLNFNDGSHDNEFGAGIASTMLPVDLALDYVYSVEAEGAFVEVTLSKGFESENGLVFSPYITQGFDYGYASEDYDGANHTQVGLAVEKEVAMNITLSGHISHSFAGSDVDRDGLGDETFGGAAVTFSF